MSSTVSRPSGGAASRLADAPRSARQRLPSRIWRSTGRAARARPTWNRPPRGDDAGCGARVRSSRRAEGGYGGARQPLSGGPRPPRRGAPPDSQDRQSAQWCGKKVGYNQSGAASRGCGSCVRASTGQLGRAPRVGHVRAILQVANMAIGHRECQELSACPVGERNDRSGASPEAPRGAHHRVVSPCPELCPSRPGPAGWMALESSVSRCQYR